MITIATPSWNMKPFHEATTERPGAFGRDSIMWKACFKWCLPTYRHVSTSFKLLGRATSYLLLQWNEMQEAAEAWHGRGRNAWRPHHLEELIHLNPNPIFSRFLCSGAHKTDIIVVVVVLVLHLAMMSGALKTGRKNCQNCCLMGYSSIHSLTFEINQIYHILYSSIFGLETSARPNGYSLQIYRFDLTSLTLLPSPFFPLNSLSFLQPFCN